MPDDIPQSFEIGGAGYPGPLDNTRNGVITGSVAL